jgi:hypothetical protein
MDKDTKLELNDSFWGKGYCTERDKTVVLAHFSKIFLPTSSQITILIMVTQGNISLGYRNIFEKLEHEYTRVLPEIYLSISRRMNEYKLAKYSSLEYIERHFKLTLVNLAYKESEDAQILLTYKFETDAPVWYVRLDKNFNVDWSDLGG